MYGDVGAENVELVENGLFVRATEDVIDPDTGEARTITILIPSSQCLLREQ